MGILISVVVFHGKEPRRPHIKGVLLKASERQRGYVHMKVFQVPNKVTSKV